MNIFLKLITNLTIIKRCLWFTIFLCLTASTQTIAFQLPVEVLGAENKTVERTFNLSRSQRDQTQKLFFYVNNLGYENKGAIRINDGSWINLNHDDINIYDKEMVYGGMQHGGMNSIRFTIENNGLLVRGENTIRFRFTNSDGISIGYRVFQFNLLDNEGNKILPNSFFTADNPNNWRAPSGFRNTQAISEGEALWRGSKTLWNHYLGNNRVSTWYGNNLQPRQQIKASCSDCHTQDGRDLEYFSYSNESIIQRSKFHGLSGDDGRRIAAYIRSLDVPRHGRPWNPPYQPGQVIGERSIEYWAAGAGIDAVLDNDAEMLSHMFPNGTSQSRVDGFFDSDKMHDNTIIPVSIQFPDWKHWLPMIHPKDAFDSFYSKQRNNGRFKAGNAASEHNPFVTYKTLRNYFNSHDHDDMVSDTGELFSVLNGFWSSFRNFFTQEIGRGTSAHWRTKASVADTYWPAPFDGASSDLSCNQDSDYQNSIQSFGQFARTSMARLMAVKFFEIQQEFKLEELNQRITPAADQPAPRQWLHGSTGYNVFEVPPHFTAEALSCATSRYVNQPGITGKFETTNWYELQLVLNLGNGRPGLTGPVDFNYTPGFIRKTSQVRPNPMRYYRAMNALYQVKSYSGDADPDNKRRGFYLNQQGLRNILPWQAPGFETFEFTETLEQVKPGANLPIKVVNAMLTQLAVELEKPQNDPSTYPRSRSGSWFSLENESKDAYDPNGGGYADGFYRWFLRMDSNGIQVSKGRVRRIMRWADQAWPNMCWSDAWPSLNFVSPLDKETDPCSASN